VTFVGGVHVIVGVALLIVNVTGVLSVVQSVVSVGVHVAVIVKLPALGNVPTATLYVGVPFGQVAFSCVALIAVP
jgi:hypothetical protein